MLKTSFQPFPILKTDRLTLRELKIQDDEEIFALRSDKQVNQFIDRAPSDTIEKARNFIHKIEELVEQNNGIYWAIQLNDNNKLVGTICLFNFSQENDQAEIGYELMPPFQGRGIMQEALKEVIQYSFQGMGVKTIEAYTHMENLRSSQLLEKYNFTKQEIPDQNSEDPYVVYKLLLI